MIFLVLLIKQVRPRWACYSAGLNVHLLKCIVVRSQANLLVVVHSYSRQRFAYRKLPVDALSFNSDGVKFLCNYGVKYENGYLLYFCTSISWTPPWRDKVRLAAVN